jgi:hypothetical protein
MGLILVWDMDDTLSHSKCVYNSNAIGLLEDAVARRPGLVDAIILLTDNSNKEYIKTITDVINVLVGSVRVFDRIVDKTDELRDPSGEKNFQTVQNIVEAIGGVSNENLEQRILFFDDLDTHPLSKELANPSQFIHVKWGPPTAEDRNRWDPNKEKDMTDYSYAENLISPPPAAVGGSRRRRTQQHQVPLKLTRRRKRLGRSLKSRHAV